MGWRGHSGLDDGQRVGVEGDFARRRRERVRLGHGADGFGEGGAEDAALGDDGGDVLRRGDVEGGVLDADAVGGDLHAVDVGDFAGGALFDGDVVAGGGGEVDGVEGRGDVEGDAVLLGEDGDGVGADLVGGVAVGGDAVGADDDGLDAALGT